jgi:hypothetical protein
MEMFDEVQIQGAAKFNEGYMYLNNHANQF